MIQNFVVLTGGPGGGKTTLIDELSCDPSWAGRFASLPEAIFLMRDIHVSPREKQFQRVIVNLQMGLEDGVTRGLGVEDGRLVLCHRGCLDPVAYWLNNGWQEADFYAFTGTNKTELYRRYAAVIHLVTSADGAVDAYKRWPEAHRPETPEQAVRLDRLLGQVWDEHPHYIRLGNEGLDWAAKSAAAKAVLNNLIAS